MSDNHVTCCSLTVGPEMWVGEIPELGGWCIWGPVVQQQLTSREALRRKSREMLTVGMPGDGLQNSDGMFQMSQTVKIPVTTGLMRDQVVGSIELSQSAANDLTARLLDGSVVYLSGALVVGVASRILSISIHSEHKVNTQG